MKIKPLLLAPLAMLGAVGLVASDAATQQYPSVVWTSHTNQEHDGVAWFPDGLRVATSVRARIQVRDMVTGTLLQTFAMPNNANTGVYCLDVDSTGTLIATASGANAFIFNARTGEVLATLTPGQGTINHLMFSPDGTKLGLAVSTLGPGVPVYEVGNWGAPAIQLTDPQNALNGAIRQISWSPDSTALATADSGITNTRGPIMRKWNVSNGTLLWSTQFAANGHNTWGVAYGSNNEIVAASTTPAPHQLTRFNGNTGAILGSTTVQVSRKLAYAPDGSSFALTQTTNQPMAIFSPDLATRFDVPDDGSAFYWARYSPDSSRILAGNTNQLRMYNAQSPAYEGATLAWTTFEPLTIMQPAGEVSDLVMTPDGMGVILGLRGNAQFRRYNAITGAVEWTQNLLSINYIRTFDVSPDGSTIAVYTWPGVSAEGGPRIRFFDAATGDEFLDRSYNPEGGLPGGVKFFQNMDRLVFANGTTRIIRVLQLPTNVGIASYTFPESVTIRSIDINAAGDRIVAACSGAAGIQRTYVFSYNSTTNVITRIGETDPSIRPPYRVRFSPSGAKFGVAYEIPSGAPTGTLGYAWVFDTENPANGIELMSSTSTVFDISIDPTDTYAITANLSGVQFRNIVDGFMIDWAGGIGGQNIARFIDGGQRILYAENTSRLGIFKNPQVPTLQGSTLYWQNPTTGQVASWRAPNGGVTSTVAFDPPGSSEWTLRAAADLNGTGMADLVWQNTSTNLLAYWILAPTGEVEEVGTLGVVAPVWQLVGAADLNDDGKADFLWRNTSDNSVIVWINNGPNAIIERRLIAVAPTDWTLVGLGDIDNDGRANVLWQNTTTGAIAVWTLDTEFNPVSSQVIGSVGASSWQLRGVARFGNEASFVFIDDSGLVAYWRLDENGNVTGTGLVGQASTDWSLRSVSVP